MGFKKENIKVIRKDKVETVDGYTFDYQLGENQSIEMGVYKDGLIWRVIDVRTGLSLQSGGTREEAVAKASDETIRTRYAKMVLTDEYLDKMLRLKSMVEKKSYKTAEQSPEPKIECGELDLDGACVCISGTLSGMTRQEAFIRLKKVGGVPSEKFTSRTTVFVIGRNAGKEKQAKAEKAVENGQAVQFVDGTTFIETLKEAEKKEEAVKPPVKLEKPKAAAKPKAAKPKAAKPKAPKPPKSVPQPEEHAISTSLDTMKKWCEGKNLIASQKNAESCIWVEGDSRAFKDELVEMGFRFARKRKSWYIDPKRA